MTPPGNGGQIDGDQVKVGTAQSDTTQSAIERFHEILGNKTPHRPHNDC